jgi:hypothetical protein
MVTGTKGYSKRYNSYDIDYDTRAAFENKCKSLNITTGHAIKCLIYQWVKEGK